MSATPRPHTSPPELAKDILGKLDNMRTVLARARTVAQRAGFQDSDARLARLAADLETATAEVEQAVRADVRRALSNEQ